MNAVADPGALARTLVEQGRTTEALEVIRAHAGDARVARDPAVAGFLGADGQLELLHRMAGVSEFCADELARLLVEENPPSVTEPWLRAAVGDAAFGWRVPLARALGAAGHRLQAGELLEEIARTGYRHEVRKVGAPLTMHYRHDVGMLERLIEQGVDEAGPRLAEAIGGMRDIAGLRDLTFRGTVTGDLAADRLRALCGRAELESLAVRGSRAAARLLARELAVDGDQDGLRRLEKMLTQRDPNG
jgi:hypothetical protein